MKSGKLIFVHNDQSQDLRRAVRAILLESRPAALVSSAVLLFAACDVEAQEVAANGPSSQAPTLAEIVVSAQKRTQSLQDVPYNISALAGDGLRDAGVVSVNSLTEVVAGLMNIDEGPANRGGNNNFVLRGLRTDAPGGGALGSVYPNLTVSPVSTYYGETPVFFQVPLDDLERVEVLRGPQGTLYGSGAQAGTIRFIPKRPVFAELSGEVTAEGSFTQYSPGANGSLHAVINFPIADHLALRLSAGEDHLGGFIQAVDRVEFQPNGTPVPSMPGDLKSGFVLGPVQRGTNSSDQHFARAALRWQPVDALDIQLEYLNQHTSMADSQFGSVWSGGPYDTSFGVYPNATVNTRPGCTFCSTTFTGEPYSDAFNLLDLVATFDVGLGTVTSSSSYSDDEDVTNFDQTGIFYGTASPPSASASSFLPYYPYLNYPRLIAATRSPNATRSFVQELRLASKPGKTFDYVAGLYYQRQTGSVNFAQQLYGITDYRSYIGQPNPSTYGDTVYLYDRNTAFEDKAIFGELTYHLADDWQITGGMRVFRQSFGSNVVGRLPLCGAICAFDQTDPSGLEPYGTSTSFSDHVWKLNSSYDFSPTSKVYATFSEGFRRGGVSGLPLYGPFASPADLQTFKPDLAKNYELGVKGSIFNHRINYFADIYIVNLYNFQFDSANLSGNIGAFNGKNARSQGAEFESQFALTDRLGAKVGYAFTRSYVTESFNILDYPPYALIPAQGGTGQTASVFGGPIAAGTRLPGVSRNVLNAAVDYAIPAANTSSNTWAWRLHLDGSYRSGQTSNINPSSVYEFSIPSAVVANGLVALESSDRVSYDLFVRNITNNPQISGGAFFQQFTTPYSVRTGGTPRTYGLGMRYRFGPR